MSSMSCLLSLTPLIQSLDHNLVRIERTDELKSHVQFIAGGPFKGIIVNKLSTKFEEFPTQFPCSFSVWITEDQGKTLKQEIRSFRFCFFHHVPMSERPATSQRFIKNLFDRNFPKDYGSFFKMLLCLMRDDYYQVKAIDVEIKFPTDVEKIPMPSVKQFANDGEMEDIQSGHVQEALEHAYPNSVTEEELVDSLRCSFDEIKHFLSVLENEGIVEKVPNQVGQWIRKAYILPQPHHQVHERRSPTIAIITCLFPEKQSVDTIIENITTTHKWSQTGDSNVYTIGNILGHHVVATKLSMIGGDRMAATSAGSITTRLLGTYQNVEHVIIVGVGGGVPHLTDPEQHVRLGDVVISDSVFDETSSRKIGAYAYAHNINYDPKTETINDLVVRDWAPKVNVLANAVKNVDRNRFLQEWQTNTKDLITRLNEQYKDQQLDFSRPEQSSDAFTMLTDEGNVIVFPHPNAERKMPLYHFGPVGSMCSFSEKTSNNENKAPSISTTPLKPTKKLENVIIDPVVIDFNNDELAQPEQNNDLLNICGKLKNENRSASTISNADSNSTRTGRMAALDDTMMEENMDDETLNVDNSIESTNRNSKINQQLREKFISGHKLRAFDAGFDSVIAAVEGSRVDSWVLIRGISDYQQGTTKMGKQWQYYASANAVAILKAILKLVPPN